MCQYYKNNAYTFSYINLGLSFTPPITFMPKYFFIFITFSYFVERSIAS